MTNTPLRTAIEHILAAQGSAPLQDLVAKLRAEGHTWHEVRDLIKVTTNGITASHQTLIEWFPEHNSPRGGLPRRRNPSTAASAA